MLKNKIVVVLFLMVFASCDTSSRPKKPDNLISKDKMEHILYELYIINAAKGVNRKILETNGFQPETYVLEKFDIDSIQFVESNEYYAFDPEEYGTIVENVKSRLEKEKDHFEALQKEEGKAAKRRRDSIQKLYKKKEPKLKPKIISDSTKN